MCDYANKNIVIKNKFRRTKWFPQNIYSVGIHIKCFFFFKFDSQVILYFNKQYKQQVIKRSVKRSVRSNNTNVLLYFQFI